jgi:hypothetical protein
MQVDGKAARPSGLGMAVTVEIKTGSRRVIEYLLSLQESPEKVGRYHETSQGCWKPRGDWWQSDLMSRLSGSVRDFLSAIFPWSSQPRFSGKI